MKYFENGKKKAILNKDIYQRSLALSLHPGFQPSVNSKNQPLREQTLLLSLFKVLASPVIMQPQNTL